MAKPDVQIYAPTTLVVGTDHVIDIDVAVQAETKVEHIEARIEGVQGWSVGSGKSRVAHRVKAPMLVSRLMGPGVLPAASTTRFSMTARLPPGTAPTHALEPAYSRLLLRIHISLPWRFDGRYHYDFRSRLPAPPAVQRTPVVTRGVMDPGKPRLELALASTRLVAGEAVVGSVAVFHVDDDDEREVELAFVPMLTLHGRGRPRDRRSRPYTATVRIPAGAAGRNVPFEVRLPETMVPSFRAATHELAWWLVASSGSFFSTKVDATLPLEIVDASAAAIANRLQAAPRLGDERMAALFATVGARAGWTGAQPEDLDEPDAGDFAIEHDLDGTRMRIAYSYRGEAGTYLVTTVDHPDLGLGLAVTPSSSLRHVFWKDVEVDIAAWDRAHHVVARSPEQAIPFLKAVVPALMRCGRLGGLARWNDDAIVLERAIASVDERELANMIGDVTALATAVGSAVAVIPPPPGLVVDVVAWQALAHALRGSFAIGDLSIRPATEDSQAFGPPVDVALEWDEATPRRIRARVGDPEQASAAAREIALSLAIPVNEALARGAERFAEQLASWPADFVDLHVADGVVSAAWQLPAEREVAAPLADALRAGAPPAREGVVADPARVRQLVDALRALHAALDPGAGPYR